MYQCCECDEYFSETYGSPIAGLLTPISAIVQVLKARTEGIGLNAAVRTFGYAKNTISGRERRLAGLHQTLFLYGLVYEFLQLIFEGDELYTKVKKNRDAHESEGWTIVVMERASRYIAVLECGVKQQHLFMKAVETIVSFFEQSKAVALFIDGERRYSQLLFDICHEVFRSGKAGRLKKVMKKNCVVRLKNKSSKRRDSEGKLKKIEAPKPEHPETTMAVDETEVHANHVEAFKLSIRRRLSSFRRRTNTYAKGQPHLQRGLDILWIIHNFVKPHFTIGKVPAVAIGILKRGLSLEEILQLRAIV
ncbi:MAG: hypothetical protein AAGD25_36705 [Cyanobacteria bacterium P01_F01_bin.150]